MTAEKRAQNVASGRMAPDGTRDLTPVEQTLPEGVDAVAEAEAVVVTTEQEV